MQKEVSRLPVTERLTVLVFSQNNVNVLCGATVRVGTAGGFVSANLPALLYYAREAAFVKEK